MPRRTPFAETPKCGISRRVERGNKATSRAALSAGSRLPESPVDIEAISAVSFVMAVILGNRASSAASIHGSTFCRASADRTLTGISLPDSKIGA